MAVACCVLYMQLNVDSHDNLGCVTYNTESIGHTRCFQFLSPFRQSSNSKSGWRMGLENERCERSPQKSEAKCFCECVTAEMPTKETNT
jgi:hypothetical protein